MERSKLKFSKSKRPLQSIKEEVENLPDFKKTIEKFEKDCYIPIINLNKDIEMGELNNILIQIASLHSKIHEKSKIHDNLSILSYYLPLLKANILTKDQKTKRRIIDRYIDPKNDFSLKNTLDSIEKFKKNIDDIDNHYHKISKIVSQNHSLENIIEFKDHRNHIKKLYGFYNKQKELIFHIGKSFIELTRKTL